MGNDETLECVVCRTKFRQPSTLGRIPLYCGDVCRSDIHYRRVRRARRAAAVEARAETVAELRAEWGL